MIIAYLCGPVTGQTYSEATDWRSAFGLDCRNVITISPMRGKEYLKKMQRIGAAVDQAKVADRKSFLSTDRAIFTRDLVDVRRSDYIVANFLGAQEKSLGSIFEIGYGKALGKGIIVVMEPGNVHDHAFIREAANFIVPRLVDAEDLLEDLGGTR